MRRPLIGALGVTVLLWMGAPGQALGQAAGCAEVLDSAERSFAIGQFDQMDDLRKCIGELSRSNQARAYELIARSSVALARLDDAEAAIGELMRRNSDFRSSPADPPLFAELVDRARQNLVRSVSKFAEDWREAPATVAVISAEVIERRGYRDLEAVLHDLPGFDFSRGNGMLYSTISQRGYPSTLTDHVLVLVDGIEQNDLHSNIAYVSRQYPLSVIERIEVVYGPASTIYGPNAFTGVIDIITKEPDAMIGNGGSHAARLTGGAGAFATHFQEATYAGRTPDSLVSWSLTGRSYRSDEPDLSDRPSWRGGYPEAFDAVDYGGILQLEGKTLDKYLCAQLAPGVAGHVLDNPDRCAVATPEAPRIMQAVASGLAAIRDVNGDGSLEIVPTPVAIERARALDKALWDAQLRGASFTYRDPTRDWFIATKVKFGDFSVGLQTWRTLEGATPWFTDRARGDGGTWVPRQSVIFAKYARPITTNLSLSMLMRYKNDQLDESRIPLMATYASGYLGLLDLASNRPAGQPTLMLDQVSTQFRSDFAAVYQRSERLRVIVGADIRDGSTQAPFFVRADTALPTFPANPNPDELKATDVGIFGQVSFDWRRKLKAVFGLRYDGNEVRENEQAEVRTSMTTAATLVRVTDFGKFLSPRAALVGTWGNRNSPLGRVILKGIYSRASQQPSNFQRFATEPYVRELASPGLGREKATNLEGSVTWDVLDVLYEFSAYSTTYSDVPQTVLRIDPCCTPARTGQFHNVGGAHVSGVQASLSTDWQGYGVYANYAYTHAEDRDPRDIFGEPIASAGIGGVGGIARHKVNAGVTSRWKFLDSSVRLNFVGDRPSVAGVPDMSAVPSSTTLNATVAYRNDARRLTAQLMLNNLLDANHVDPGVRGATVLGYAGTAPQPGFNAFAQLVLDFNFARRRD